MMGKNHIITNYATLASSYTLIKLANKGLSERMPLVSSKIADMGSYMVSYTNYPTWVNIGLGLAIFALGSLLPDIDNKNSTLGKIIHIPIEHRTWLHTVWFILPFAILSFFNALFVWLSLGMFLHIFWDSFSVGGICFFKPNYTTYANGGRVKKGHKLKLYRAGDISEKLIVFFIVLTSLIIIYLGFKYGVYKFEPEKWDFLK